jgi:hypothetical protein
VLAAAGAFGRLGDRGVTGQVLRVAERLRGEQLAGLAPAQ